MWLKRIAALALALLIGFLIAEVTVRVLGLGDRSLGRFRYHPDFGWTIDPRSDVRGDINADGFRYPPVDRTKRAGRARVVILGDSFAEGDALPWSQTFAGMLESWLNAPGTARTWEVLNLGVSGWGSAQEALSLQRYALRLDPDVVVWQAFPFNDLCNNSLELADTCSLLDYRRPYLVPRDGRLQVAYSRPWAAPLRRSVLFRMVEDQLTWGIGGLVGPGRDQSGREHGARRNRRKLEVSRRLGLRMRAVYYSLVPEDGQPEVIARAWRTTEALVSGVVGTLGDRGVQLIPVIIPYSETFDDDWVATKQRTVIPKNAPSGLRLQADYATSRWGAMFGALGVPVVSVRDLIAADPVMLPMDYFHPYGKELDRHLNSYGHYMVASWILAEMRRRNLTAVSVPDDALGKVDLLGSGPLPACVTGAVDTGGGRRSLSGRGGATTIVFRSGRSGTMRLDFEVRSVILGQTMTVVVNGVTAETFEISDDRPTRETVIAAVRPGRNEVRLVYSRVNEDGRRLAVEFSSLEVTFEPEPDEVSDGGLVTGRRRAPTGCPTTARADAATGTAARRVT